MYDLTEISDIYVRPCVDGNSSTNQYFNYSLISSCNEANCTKVLKAQPGANMVSPILLGLAGISGHICALVYLHRGTRRSNQKSTFYIMLATLIWTDLIGKLITTPSPVIAYIYGHWVGGVASCNGHGYAMSLIGLVTHLLVATMALERYLGIRCGYFYTRVVTTSRTRLLLISLWLFGLLFSALPLLGMGEFKVHYPGTWCYINQHPCSDDPLRHRVYAHLYSTMNLLCFCVIVICNVVVVGTLLKMRLTTFRPSKSCQKLPEAKKPKDKEIQMVILLVIITITFIVSWAALDLLLIINEIWPASPNQDPIFDIKVIRLVSFNQIIDPWTYIICRIIFRSKMWKCCQRIFIGKINTRRFSEGGREIGSFFHSFASGKRNKTPSPDGIDYKRASLPNPKIYKKENESIHNFEDSFSEIAQTKRNSLDTPFHSESEEICQIELQKCFPPDYRNNSRSKSSRISSTLSKFFKMSPKKSGETYVQIEPQKQLKRNLALLSPQGLYTVSSGTLKSRKSEDFRKHSKKISSVSECFEDQNEQLLKSRGSKSSLHSGRSNSWCCPNEYTLRDPRLKEK